MLTDSEREWLKDRRNKAYCRYCSVIDLCSNPNASGFKCPLIPDYEEAAEFSERVASLLAEIMPKALADPWFIKNAKDINADVTLKWAQLSVEEEMNAD